MDYGKLISTNLRNAFRQLKGIAVDITLTKNKNVSFDFASSVTSVGTVETVPTKAVTVSKEKLIGNNTLTETIMLQREALGDITGYDKVTHRGLIWSIGPVISDDNYIMILKLVREVGHG